MLSFDIIDEIYNICNPESRMILNKTFNWSFYFRNPLKYFKLPQPSQMKQCVCCASIVQLLLGIYQITKQMSLFADNMIDHHINFIITIESSKNRYSSSLKYGEKNRWLFFEKKKNNNNTHSYVKCGAFRNILTKREFLGMKKDNDFFD